MYLFIIFTPLLTSVRCVQILSTAEKHSKSIWWTSMGLKQADLSAAFVILPFSPRMSWSVTQGHTMNPLSNVQCSMFNVQWSMPLNRLQLKIYAFSGKFNVCSKCVLLSWIKICCDFTLQTQIFTQKYRSWLRFYSEFLRKNLAGGASGGGSAPSTESGLKYF